MLKHTMTAVALSALATAPALAQQTNPATPSQPAQMQNAPASSTMSSQQTGFVQKQNASEWRGSKLIGASVYGPDNNSIGEINDVLIGDNGNVRAVVIGVGGFLGVGEKDVALPFSALNVTRKSGSSAVDKITVTYTKDQLNNAPKFAYYDNNQAQTTGERTGSQPMNSSK